MPGPEIGESRLRAGGGLDPRQMLQQGVDEQTATAGTGIGQPRRRDPCPVGRVEHAGRVERRDGGLFRGGGPA